MATKQQVPVLVARLVEFQDEFLKIPTADVQWAIMNGRKAANLIAGAIANREKVMKLMKPSITRLISAGEMLMIEELDGADLIGDAKEVFDDIDSDFYVLGFIKSGPATAETLVDVSESVNKWSFSEIFTDISSDVEKLILTQAQIIRFCKNYPNWLRNTGFTFLFLTKINGKHIVIQVFSEWDGCLGVTWHPYNDSHVWSEKSYRVVYPRVIPCLKVEQIASSDTPEDWRS